MIKQFILILLTFTFSAAKAQEYEKIANPKICKEAISQKASSTKSIKADFSEKVYSEMLKTPTTGSGIMLYKKKNKLRWEHTKPKSQIILMSGDNIKIKDDGKEVKNALAKKFTKKVQDVILQLLTGEFVDGDDFTVSYFENTNNYKLKLKPKDKLMAKYIATIELVFDKKTITLNQLTMGKNSSDKIVYSFSDVELNADISDSKFTNF